MPNDPRASLAVRELAARLKTLELNELVEELRTVKDDDRLGWVRYHFMNENEMKKPWQVIVINRWLERDKFFRNILPAWLGTAFGVLSFVVAVLALVVALHSPTP
jgi:hypothetical protein